jgi:serine/threonine protein phosphatase PrpC
LCHTDVFRFELTEYDKFLIVSSNGVWEYMSNDDVLNLAIDKKNSQELCEDIVKESLNKWKERFKNNVDDISVVVVAVNVRKG